MNFKELFEAQKELDQRIVAEHNLKDADLLTKKVMSFIVEIGECANEIRFFKFWSNKAASPREIILEEYVDSLHFILSIGNDLSKIFSSNIQNHLYNIKLSYGTLTDDFINIIYSICAVNSLRNKDNIECINLYINTFEQLLMIGHKLGFSFKDIEMAYYKKHAENFKRQDEGY